MTEEPKMEDDIVLPTPPKTPITDAIFSTVTLQAFILIFSSLASDGGSLFQLMAYGSIAFWGSAFLLLYRSKRKLTKINFLFLRYGAFLAYLLSCCLCDLIWKFRGLV